MEITSRQKMSRGTGWHYMAANRRPSGSHTATHHMVGTCIWKFLKYWWPIPFFLRLSSITRYSRNSHNCISGTPAVCEHILMVTQPPIMGFVHAFGGFEDSSKEVFDYGRNMKYIACINLSDPDYGTKLWSSSVYFRRPCFSRLKPVSKATKQSTKYYRSVMVRGRRENGNVLLLIVAMETGRTYP